MSMKVPCRDSLPLAVAVLLGCFVITYSMPVVIPGALIDPVYVRAQHARQTHFNSGLTNTRLSNHARISSAKLYKGFRRIWRKLDKSAQLTTQAMRKDDKKNSTSRTKYRRLLGKIAELLDQTSVQRDIGRRVRAKLLSHDGKQSFDGNSRIRNEDLRIQYEVNRDVGDHQRIFRRGRKTTGIWNTITRNYARKGLGGGIFGDSYMCSLCGDDMNCKHLYCNNAHATSAA